MKHCIFDIDGTLIDTATLDRVSFQAALRQNGYAFADEQLRFAFGMPGRASLKKLGIDGDRADAVMRCWEELLYGRLDEIEIFPGVIETLETLRAQGKTLGIVTSRTRYQLDAGFTPLGLNRYFDAIVCADEVAQPKPAPDELIECIRRLGGTTDEAVYVGDSVYDMQCARAAGVPAVLALWGCYDPSEIESDLRFTHPSALLTL